VKLALQVVGSFGNDEAHAAGGVGHVAGVPGDEVDVQVGHRLSRRLAVVDADVVPGQVVQVVDAQAHAVDQVEEGGAFGGRGVGEGRDVPPGHDEGVARGDGVLVPQGEDELLLLDELGRVGGGEGAQGCRGHGGLLG